MKKFFEYVKKNPLVVIIISILIIVFFIIIPFIDIMQRWDLNLLESIPVYIVGFALCIVGMYIYGNLDR